MISQELSAQDRSATPDRAAQETWLCSQGHYSTEADFCSECGIKIAIDPASPLEPTPEATADSTNVGDRTSLTCPDCGGLQSRDQGNFCEACGYNFSLATSASGCKAQWDVTASEHGPLGSEVAKVEAEVKAEVETEVKAEVGWTIAITLDPSLWDAAVSPAPPDLSFEPVLLAQVLRQDPGQAERSRLDRDDGIDLAPQERQLLIGRTSQSQAIYPEIALDFDSAISQRHAILVLQPNQALSLRDLNSSNGTMFNGQTLIPLQDYPLHHGDSLTLGHWTRLTFTLRQSP